MANDLVKRFIKKDGSQRISFYREEYADSPRDMTDEPLHCEDWSRDYSIMDKHERESKSEDAGKLIRYLLARYGDNKKIIKLLKDNYKSEKHDAYDNALSYDRSRKEWIVWSWQPSWKDYQGNVYEAHWSEEWAFCINIYDVDLCNITDTLSDEQIETLCDEKYWTDNVKMMSYSFGYYGEISFDREFSTDSEGICWLEKDEFLKYRGCKEEYWNGKSLDEIEWLLDELEAWSENEVYGFVVEDAVKTIVNTRYPNGEHDDTEEEMIEWEEKGLNSCWGLYGDIDEVKVSMFDQAGLDINEFEEVKI